MADPKKTAQNPENGEDTLVEHAAKMAAGDKMAQTDYLPSLVNSLIRDSQTLTKVFNEKQRRQAEADKAAGVTEQTLPDMAELKMVIDAESTAIQAEFGLRAEQRNAMVFASQWAEMERRFKEGQKIGKVDFK